MTERALITVVRCVTAVALAVVLPAWMTAVPLAVLAGATSVAIIRRPELGARALEAIEAILSIPSSTHETKLQREDLSSAS